MKYVRAGLRRFRDLFRTDRLERDLADELEAHLQLHTDDNVRAGMCPDDARRHALLSLGGVESVKEHYRDQRGIPMLEVILKDLGFGLRLLRKQPAFTFGAVATLTIGVAANVLVFSIANALVIRPLPISDPGQVVRAYVDGYSNTPYSDYVDYRDRNQTLSGLAAFANVPLVVRRDGAAEPVSATAVSGEYFETLGLPASVGRMIVQEDDRAGAPGVVVLSHAYWQRRFSADSGIVGQSVVVNGWPFTVVGIAPAAFVGTQAPLVVDAWVPWHAPSLTPAPENRSAHLIGRIRPGASLAQAQMDVAHVAAQRAQRAGRDRAQQLVLSPAGTLLPQMASQVNTFLQVMGAVAVLVLLIACVNIAGLLLARAEGRRREIAVRLALGAGRRRLIGQLLTESVLLSSFAALAASIVVITVGRLLARVSLPIGEPVALDVPFDWRVMAFTLGLSVLTAVLFGLAPAVQASGLRVVSGLRGGAGAGGQRTRLRRALITLQVAISTVLLIGAGVLVRSLVEARRLDLGFSTQDVLTVNLDLSTRSYAPGRGIELFHRLRGQLARDPQVSAVSIVGTLPLTVSSQAFAFLKEGAARPAPNERLPPVFFDSISPGYFRTVEMPLVLGRDFTPADDAGAPPVVIVNQTLADRFWPGENPIGKRLQSLAARNAFGPLLEVVGLARNAKYATVGEAPKAFVYFPLAQQYKSRVTLLVKATGRDSTAVLTAVRSAVAALDPDAPLSRISTLHQATGVSLLPLRVAAGLTTGLGIAALVLAAVGIYGVTAFLVRQRTRELGIRLALGAAPSRVVRALTRESLWFTTMGIGLGLVASLAATSFLGSFLYGVTPTDPVVFVAIPALLILTAYAAGRIPAGAATRIDPIRALRDE
jgi:predicted permease